MTDAESAWTPRRCAIHVHTILEGDGACGVEELLEAARAGGVDALVLTDHDRAHAAEAGFEGYHDGLLCMVGAEFTTRDRDHILAFGVHDRVNTLRHTGPDAVHLLNQLGASTFIAHPQGRPRYLFLDRRYTWRHWGLKDFDGIEVWSYMMDWIDGLGVFGLPARCREPAAYIQGPHPWVVAQWDAEATRRRVAALGGQDNHGWRLPLGLGRLLSWGREGVLPFEQVFRDFAHYALTPPPTGEARADLRDLNRALREGRGWIAHEALGDARAFRFDLEKEGERQPVGSEARFEAGDRLHVVLPEAATIRLHCRGEIVAEVADGDRLTYEPTEPGEYRVEADREGRAWIRTNHIYLRGESHIFGSPLVKPPR